MANFPSSVSTDANLYVSVNGLQTTLSASILSTDTTIPLVSTSNFPPTGYVTIDNMEIVLYSGVSGSTLTGCTRGADGSVAFNHSLGASVGLSVVAAHHNLLKDEIIAIESTLGAGFSIPVPVGKGGTGVQSLTSYAVIVGGATPTAPVQSVGSVGLPGQVLTSQGPGAKPIFQNTTGSGTVDSGVQDQLAYYASDGATISGLPAITPNRALESDANGLPVASPVSSATLSHLDATSSVQTQLDSKLPLAGGTMSGPIDMGSQPILNVASSFLPTAAATVQQVNDVPAFQVGDLKAAAYSSTPSGWLLCDGSAVSRTTYANLFSVIGTAYGVGDGSSTFNVPNLVDYVPVGKGGSIAPSLGSTSGSTSNTPTTSSDGSHDHVLNTVGTESSVNLLLSSAWRIGVNSANGDNSVLVSPQAGGGETLNRKSAQTDSEGLHSHTVTVSTVQPSVGVNWFIKA